MIFRFVDQITVSDIHGHLQIFNAICNGVPAVYRLESVFKREWGRELVKGQKDGWEIGCGGRLIPTAMFVKRYEYMAGLLALVLCCGGCAYLNPGRWPGEGSESNEGGIRVSKDADWANRLGELSEIFHPDPNAFH